MTSYGVLVYPLDPEFHPSEAQEEALRSALLDLLDDPGDIEASSAPKPCPVEVGDAGDNGDRARFVLQVSGLAEPHALSEEGLARASKAMGAPCKQASARWEDDG